MKILNVLSYDDNDSSAQQLIVKFLSATCFVEISNNEEDFFNKLRTKSFDVLLLDLNLGKGAKDGTALIPQLRAEFPNLAIIILTSDDNFNNINKAYSLGASDYILKSDSFISDLIIRIPQAVRRMRKDRLVEQLSKNSSIQGSYVMMGGSKYNYELNRTIQSLRNTHESILISGPPGSGKTTVAKEIFKGEQDPLRPKVYLNLNLIPPQMMDRELFGEVSDSLMKGRSAFLHADNGDLVLDGVELLPLEVQNRLLKVLNKNSKEPFGGPQSSVRLISIFNGNPKEALESGKFSPDLLKAISHHQITMEPLIKRSEDIKTVAFEILSRNAHRNYKFTNAALEFLTNYSWPGNFTQLIYILESVTKFIEIETNEIDVSDLLRVDRTLSFPVEKNHKKLSIQPPQFLQDITREHFDSCMNEVEKTYLESVMKLCKYDTIVASKRLYLSRSTLYKKMELYNLKQQS